jgi:hypothetical protein
MTATRAEVADIDRAMSSAFEQRHHGAGAHFDDAALHLEVIEHALQAVGHVEQARLVDFRAARRRHVEQVDRRNCS